MLLEDQGGVPGDKAEVKAEDSEGSAWKEDFLTQISPGSARAAATPMSWVLGFLYT